MATAKKKTAKAKAKTAKQNTPKARPAKPAKKAACKSPSISVCLDTFSDSGIPIIMAGPHSEISYVNAAFLDTFGGKRASYGGKNAIEFVAGMTNGKYTGEMIRTAIKEEGTWQGEVFHGKGKNKGSLLAAVVPARRCDKGQSTVAFFDISALKKTEEMLQRMAHYDILTGLPNRALMIDRLKQTISLAKRHHTNTGVMLLDLDRFKEVNDTLGHHVGDQLLVEASARLKSCVRESDTVARMGGDEFLVILPEIGSPANSAHIAQKMHDILIQPFNLAGHDCFVSASIGIAIHPHDGDDPDVLVKNADTAMYHAKAQGKNNFKFFTEDINKTTIERFLLENRFRQALDKLEFQLNYQPKVDIKTGRIAGMEALLRWYHPDQGNVKPSLFIPLAEETGLVVPLGEWALREACRQTVEWHKMGMRPVRVSVNLSARQFRKRDLVDMVKNALEESGLAPEYLMLEITETTIIEKIEETITTLNAFRSIGVKVSIDDFGTGYSSLNYLNRFAVDELKIDGSFIADIGSLENRKVVTAIIALAHGLNHKVVAEGVETREQLEFLRDNQCNEVQGYLFSKPLSAIDFQHLIKRDPDFMAASGS